MNKQIKLITKALVLSIILSSCGNSIENDAKKLAKLMCKSQKFTLKTITGDYSGMKESLQIMKEAGEFKKVLGNKYEKEESKKEFETALLRAIADLDCK